MSSTQTAVLNTSSIKLIKRLWYEQLHLHKAYLVLILLLTGIMAGVTALYPLVIQRALDMFANHDPRILYQVPLLVIVITAIKAISQYSQTIAVQSLILKVIRVLQGRMYASLLKADIARIERESPATLASHFTSDAISVREAMIRIVNSLGDGVTVVGLVISMFYMDWELSLIAAFLYPLASIPIQKIGRHIRQASGSMQVQIGQTSSLLNESFSQARTIRVYGLEKIEIRRVSRILDALNKAFLRIVVGRARVDPVLEVLGGVAIAFVLGFAGWRAAMGGATLGDFSGFIAALLLASRPVRALGSLSAALQEGLAGLARVFVILNEKPTIHNNANAVVLPHGKGKLEFRNVVFIYEDGRVGLNSFNLVIEAGQTVALVGPSGAGKSTALSLIPRLRDVTSGTILLDGLDIRLIHLDDLRRTVAYVSQDPLLFDMTVADNIAMGKQGANIEDIRIAARDAAAEDFIQALPKGFDTYVGTGGQALSGGQRQRVSLARALLRNPRLLLLDEATSALDAESESMIQNALLRLRSGRTTLIVAHRLSTVRSADSIAVLDEGHVVEQGTHGHLLKLNGLYARLVRTQGFLSS